ncbi:bifunctional folylpolyglutamate synthase/dihydrofolate synthase [Pacificimonas sp. WHA3]|uniref:Dihydrofolate synthase/folylpolyglutamate synthase n=1 Tax=Pacificimonas pallii TaxID=2827236 RepID=A0ABS6SGT1_9SPHN|nr:bifunctional folylpolyglutamate synthase/dihydrofolate synthase [Pacificimonas pallii]
MGDGARSDDDALNALLEEARRLHPQSIDLSLGRLEALLEKLGNPHLHLPPTFHVAGTNGKGSVCAFLRSALEAAGYKVHVYSSPHLVRFNERFRLAGQLIEDGPLTALMREVMQANDGAPITFFELTTAAAFTAFHRTPADALVLEVGLGGRFDATNVIRNPAVCGVVQIARDHEKFLGTDILGIAFEKASIAKPGVPIVTARYPAAIAAKVGETAALAGGKLIPRGLDWDATFYQGELHYRDRAGKVTLTPPRLPGAHQHDNAALATAMLRHQSALAIPESALRAGPGWASWPGRLQRLESGPLVDLLPAGTDLWLDGGHNPAAGRAIADFLRRINRTDRPVHLITGMIDGKDARAYLKPLAARAETLCAVPVSGHLTQQPGVLAEIAGNLGLTARRAAGVAEALRTIPSAADAVPNGIVLICGSLYLAGEVLAENGPLPT